MHSHTQSHTHAHKHCLLLGFWQIYFAETKKPKPKRTFACGLRPAICKRSLATFDSTRLDSGVVGVVSGSLLSRVCVLAFVSCSLMCSPTVSLSVSPAVYPSPLSPPALLAPQSSLLLFAACKCQGKVWTVHKFINLLLLLLLLLLPRRCFPCFLYALCVRMCVCVAHLLQPHLIY